MPDCTCLIHPFQHDPGTSQRQRTMENLLAGAAKIDARTLADLLDFFVQLSGHINYYDFDLNKKDWQPFFKKSIPFTLAAMIKYPLQTVESNLELYNSIFQKKPSAAGLQLNSFFIYYRFINTINDWQQLLQHSGLPIAQLIDELIKSKLQLPVKWFIKYSNAAIKLHGIKKMDFTKLLNNTIWGLVPADIYAIDTALNIGTKSKFKKLNNLYNEFSALVPILKNAIKIISKEASLNLEQSFIPLQEALQQQHQPQLALIFTFLSMFRQLQNDLNKYTRKHLDYFYKDILCFKSAAAIADKTHVIFEIQKQLRSYLLKKGLILKDGKDNNKQQILFALDDDIVVTKTTIADKRTLFLNNKNYKARTYVEGVYMSTVAEMADGVEKEFKDDPKNFPTVGGKYSKYQDPETKLCKPYPNARLGFILASPVLFLQQGSTRTVDISLNCQLEKSLCGAMGNDIITTSKGCCNNFDLPGTKIETNRYPEFYPADGFYDEVNSILQCTYYYINLDLLKEAVKNGISDKLAEQLKLLFLTDQTAPLCYCPTENLKYESTITAAVFNTKLDSLVVKLTAAERKIIDDLLKPRRVLNLLFSGEKAWLEPSLIDTLEVVPMLSPLTGTLTNQFILHIKAILNSDKAAVTFYDYEKLKEDFGTTQPLVKIELDDKIKFTNLEWDKMPKPLPAKDQNCVQDEHCCLLKEEVRHNISLYHFFRNVLVGKIEDVDIDKPIITVNVCGLKNFIVQNDESVMDVNGPIYPFGARPDIIDFGVSDLVVQYVITADFIADVQPHIAASTTAILNALLPAAGIFEVGNNYADVESFLALKIIVPADVITIRTQLQSKNYTKRKLNLIGPNFFIGSKEIFCKHWTEVFINLNWKDKPSDFRDYYKAYLYQKNYLNPGHKLYGLNDQEFEINLSLLEEGKWVSELKHEDLPPGPPYAEETTLYNTFTAANNRRLFPAISTPSFCPASNAFQQTYHLKKIFFSITNQSTIDNTVITKYDVNARNGFLRINLQNQDFLHKDFGYVLARQMNAAAMLVNVKADGSYPKIEDAIYYDNDLKGPVVFSTDNIKSIVSESGDLALEVRNDINAAAQIKDLANGAGNGNPIIAADADSIRKIINPPTLLQPSNLNLTTTVETLENKIEEIKNQINSGKDFQAIIPKEPWTPVISNMELDYKAFATSQDIDLIHVYPYQNTYRQQEMASQPTLFPSFCDEGSLFLGLKELIPGDNLNILFQLAEATSDSESNKEAVYWYYLDSNVWKPLRNGFEVLEDATKELTTSGIVIFAMPANITKDNTVMPKDLYWIKATIAKNSKSVSETISIMPQAMLAIFTNEHANDKARLAKPLPKESISKLNEADAAVKSVTQPFASFGGAVPEIDNQFYVRVSETLKHKGRAIQAFDYERLALEAFPQLYKVKCINHSFALNAQEYSNDFPYAPGYVMLAVIPDLNKLQAGNSFEPKVPVSIIEDIEAFMCKRTAPFVRFRAMNPRYEKINFCLRVRLIKGKDENYFRDKIKQDIKEFMAPWAVGVYDKLSFGQCVFRSDIIGLLEKSGYVDFIADLQMGKENDKPMTGVVKVCPDTPRSILIAGNIEVCIDKPGCETWSVIYTTCDNEKPVLPCNNKTEIIINYCK